MMIHKNNTCLATEPGKYCIQLYLTIKDLCMLLKGSGLPRRVTLVWTGIPRSGASRRTWNVWTDWLALCGELGPGGSITKNKEREQIKVMTEVTMI